MFDNESSLNNRDFSLEGRMRAKKTIKKTILLATLSLLSSACSFSTSESVIKMDDGYEKVKGTVTKIFNLVIPTAHANDSVICRSKKSGKTANVINVFLLRNGVETKLCDADIQSNGEFEVELKKDLVPVDGVVIFKSNFNGGEREKLAIGSEIKTGAALEVNPFTTAVSNSLKREAEVGEINTSKINLASQLVQSVFGNDIKIGASLSLSQFIKEATSSESFKVKAAQFLSGAVDTNDDHFKNIKTQVERVKSGREIEFREELFLTPQSTLKRYAYFKKSGENDRRRTSGKYYYKRNYDRNRMTEFLKRYGVTYGAAQVKK